MKPLVSIIVPAYNEQKHIEQCLLSIKQQIFSRYELILVDDGSTDKTRKIACKYVDILISQEHQGAGVARNKGVEKANGNILVFIDADMYIDCKYLEKLIHPILTHKAEATWTKEEYVANTNNIWSRCFQIDNNLPLDRRIAIKKNTKSNKFRAIKKQLFYNTSGYLKKSGYGEDAIFKEQIAVNAVGAVCYHYNPDSLKDVFLSARWIGRSRLKKKTLKNLLKYSLINSMLISIKKIKIGAPIQFIIYKIVFDLGLSSGILYKNKRQNYAK